MLATGDELPKWDNPSFSSEFLKLALRSLWLVKTADTSNSCCWIKWQQTALFSAYWSDLSFVYQYCLRNTRWCSTLWNWNRQLGVITGITSLYLVDLVTFLWNIALGLFSALSYIVAVCVVGLFSHILYTSSIILLVIFVLILICLL